MAIPLTSHSSVAGILPRSGQEWQAGQSRLDFGSSWSLRQAQDQAHRVGPAKVVVRQASPLPGCGADFIFPVIRGHFRPLLQFRQFVKLRQMSPVQGRPFDRLRTGSATSSGTNRERRWRPFLGQKFLIPVPLRPIPASWQVVKNLRRQRSEPGGSYRNQGKEALSGQSRGKSHWAVQMR